jgi:membrane protease YdiL (CAAX protease family)
VFAATGVCALAVPLGFVVGYIYEKTDSLWMPVTIHYLFNIVPFLAG